MTSSWMDEELDGQDDLSSGREPQPADDFPPLTPVQPNPPHPTAAPFPSPWTKLFSSSQTPNAARFAAPPLRKTDPTITILPSARSNPSAVIIASPPGTAASPQIPTSSSTPASVPVIPAPPPSTSVSPVSPTASLASPGGSGVSHLILDSAAFITGSPLSTYGPSCVYLTVAEVVQELRDEAARERFQTSAFPIHTRQPSAEAVHAVTAFAQRTGDLAALSSTDILVLALAWQVEREVNGGRNLKESPASVNERALQAIIASNGQATTVIAAPAEQSVHSQREEPNVAVGDVPEASDGSDDDADEDEERSEVDEDGDGTTGEGVEGAAVSGVAAVDDGEGEWITPENLHQQREYGARHSVVSTLQSGVAIITTDFAMQVGLSQATQRRPSLTSSPTHNQPFAMMRFDF